MKIAVNALNLQDTLAGIGYYTEYLNHALTEFPEVEMIHVFVNARAAAYLDRHNPKVRVRSYRLPGSILKTLFAQTVFPWLAGPFDLVHSVGNVAVLATRKPQVVTVHDLSHKAIGARFSLLKRLYLGAGFVLSLRMKGVPFVCDTFSTEGEFHRWYPASRGRTTVVHLACRLPVTRKEPLRQGLLFVGTLEPGKNLALALKALAILKNEFGMAPLLKIVGGRGWKQSSLPGLVESLGIGDQLLFLGRIDDEELRVLYEKAVCLVYPSLYEGFGFPILEAQSQGCLVVSAVNSCLPEIGGEGALYFSDNDARALAARLREVLSDGAGLPLLREKGYANVARFSWRKTATETLQIFREALSARRVSPP